MAKRAGKYGKVTVGGQVLAVTKWTAKYGIGETDVTDTNSNGHGESIGNIDRIEFTLEANWDSAAIPTAPTPGLVPGEGGPAISLFINKNDATAWAVMPSTFISDVNPEGPVDGKVSYTVTGKSNGDFTVATA